MKFNVGDFIIYNHYDWNIDSNIWVYRIKEDMSFSRSVIIDIFDLNLKQTNTYTTLSYINLNKYILLSEMQEKYPERFL